jgi:hypothetical protein
MEPYGLFIGTLMQSRNQAHIFHLQTPSFAAHKALRNYYEDIVELIDGLVESYQGRYGILRGYKMESIIKEDDSVVTYFEGLCKFVEIIRTKVPQDSYIQNEIDNVVNLIESTKYKLKFLH